MAEIFLMSITKRYGRLTPFLHFTFFALLLFSSEVSHSTPRTIDILRSFNPRAQWLYHYSVDAYNWSNDTSLRATVFNGTKSIRVLSVIDDTIGRRRLFNLQEHKVGISRLIKRDTELARWDVDSTYVFTIDELWDSSYRDGQHVLSGWLFGTVARIDSCNRHSNVYPYLSFYRTYGVDGVDSLSLDMYGDTLVVFRGGCGMDGGYTSTIKFTENTGMVSFSGDLYNYFDYSTGELMTLESYSAIEDSRNNIPNNLTLDFSPCPLTSDGTIRLNMPKEQRVTIGMFDVLGRHVDDILNMSMTGGEHLIVLHTASYRPGTYFCRVQTEGEVQSRMFVVSK